MALCNGDCDIGASSSCGYKLSSSFEVMQQHGTYDDNDNWYDVRVGEGNCSWVAGGRCVIIRA